MTRHCFALALAAALAAAPPAVRAGDAEPPGADGEPHHPPAEPPLPPPLPPPPAAVPPPAGEVRHLRAARWKGAMVLDGRLDEAAWQAAEEGSGFTQLDPDEGQPATVQTRFRVLWDDQYLYFGAVCDDPEPPTARLSRRDRAVEGDWVSIDFDTTFDHRTAYHFQVYAAGQQLDALHFDDTNYTSDWDATWESQVARTPAGWSVEMRIPLRNLRIPDGAKQFGFNVYRRLSRRAEEDQFRFRSRGTPGDVSQLAVLDGVEGIRPASALELRPYLAGRVTRTDPWPGPVRAPGALGPCASTGFSPLALGAACAGLDLRYGLASDLSLVATLNPDFGQVEADQLVLNLTTFETFFPEKRPFFLEGLDLFRSAVGGALGGPYGGQAYQLFYSRRIGRPPTSPDLPDGASELYRPASRPVLGAVKLSGTVGQASVGLLASVEPPVDAQVRTADGRVSDWRLDDSVASAALRVRAPLASGLLAGAMATSVDPLFSPGGRHAHVGLLDFVLFNDKRSLTLSGQATGSLLSGGTRDVLRDGTVIDSPDAVSGGAASATLDYTGEYTGGFWGVDWLSPTFTTNDLGYMRRANLARAFGLFNLRQPHPTAWTQRIQLTLHAREVHDAPLDVLLYRGGGAELNVTWINYWYSQLGAYWEAQAADDRELGDGTPLERQKALAVYAYNSTDQKKPVHLELFGMHRGEIARAHDYWEADATIGFRPHPQLEGGLDLGWSIDDGTIRRLRAATGLPESGADPTVELDPGGATARQRLYLLAPLKARSIYATLRATFAFSPRLTLQVYTQLFTAGLAYGDALRAVSAPGKAMVRYADLQPAGPLDQPPNDDQRDAGLNVNLILRWEWRLGSTLYLVYAHSTSNSYTPVYGSQGPHGLDLGRELGALSRDQGATNGDTLLLKIDLLHAL